MENVAKACLHGALTMDGHGGFFSLVFAWFFPKFKMTKFFYPRVD